MATTNVRTRGRPRTGKTCQATTALAERLLNQQLTTLQKIQAEACGRVIRLRGPMDAATRRLAERLARTVLGAEDVRFEDAA